MATVDTTIITPTAPELLDAPAAMLAAASALAGGSAPWRNRKRAEAADLVAFGRRAARRFEVASFDLRTDLRAIVRIRTPVPLREGGQITIGTSALLGLMLPEEFMTRPVSGTGAVCVLFPAHSVQHGNIAPVPGQPMCLGSALPPGIPLRELVVMAWSALSLQPGFVVEARDPAGVLNPEAAAFWDGERANLPLLNDRSFLNPPAGL